MVEDAFYRQFINNGEYRTPCSQEEVTVLHNDYHILNSYIVNKYNIQGERNTNNLSVHSISNTSELVGIVKTILT